MKGDDTVAFVGIGSNVGDRLQNCEKSVGALGAARHLRDICLSSWYLSAPVGYVEQDWFVNGALRALTSLGSLELLDLLEEVENELGKDTPFRWGPRTIDLDLLLYGDQILSFPRLQVPHPRMAERRFVMEPLAEIDPDRLHPLLGQTFARLLAVLPREPRVIRLGPSRRCESSPSLRMP